MQIADRAEMAQMGEESLKSLQEEIAEAKKNVAAIAGDCDSAAGKHILERLIARLDEIRGQYGRISVAGKGDRDIVMAFMENRIAEQFVQEEIDSFSDAKKTLESLDEAQAICNSILVLREKSNRTER